MTQFRFVKPEDFISSLEELLQQNPNQEGVSDQEEDSQEETSRAQLQEIVDAQEAHIFRLEELLSKSESLATVLQELSLSLSSIAEQSITLLSNSVNK